MTSDAKAATTFEEGLKGASEKVAEFQDDKTALKRIQHWLHQTPSAVPMIVLVVALVIFGVLSANFFKPTTLSTILQQIAIVGILGCAQSIVVLTAGIDLSVGAIAVFSSVLMGQMTFRYGIPAPLAILIGLALGTAMGFINGWLVAKVKLPPFIVTLGTWQILLASNFIFSANETIRSSDIAAQAPALQFWGNAIQPGGVKVLYAVFLMIALVAIMAYVLRHTAWGRHVYAVGDDPDAAELAGVQTKRILIQVYALAGLFCAIAGWVMIGRFGSVSPTASTGQLGNIQSITAVVIGGISLFGGRGSIVGMFFGALIVGVFEMGLRLVGTDPQWTFFLIGVLIIFAVAVDQWIRKVSA
ncbi:MULTISPECIES: ABC transporter permease [Gemmobacter]|jgi:fructose transport system permease protein|uniref:Mannose ABC transporter membrane protein /fructose ABC transporter membrane protein /ribose ABC transporter membrane protein n=2 Tax=Gemmobacter TaxID=204456 RepID=A0A2T6ASK8_9RHOB|nr:MULTISPECIES: ABC transporter permease [Gemmobacter]OJY25514.1 MAG: ABC transporter permease [Rhodobacterales bacterium 65-51]PTX46789.1 mannose ABC transporter membrane protein /fructose ABC transporter membrane protein /ribose ABC transporter membrane protein [Gemmobacter caeni]TWI95737.1 mannose ABC transporter membrane protein/fructose ABC transporter membrane protein/ribose ABC transporter membrane protein [Gemmobacter caeni]GHC23743.1 ABC transporter permease [Gemmobacter nanjingensis]